MRIALITSMKYGLTQFIVRDVAGLIERGHEVRLFTLRRAAGLYNPPPDWDVVPVRRAAFLRDHLAFALRHPARYRALAATAHATHSWVDLSCAVGFARQMADRDLIFSYFGDHKLFTGYYAKRITGLPLAVTIRAYELHRNPNPPLFVRALAACDRVLTITEFNQRLLTERYGVPAERIEIIRQVVDLELYRDQPRVRVLIVGFFAEKKGHELLFRAIQKLGRPDIEVWVVGDINPSVNAVDCRALVQAMGLERQVAFFGAQSGAALRALYQACDVFCLPSRTDSLGDHEGFPNVIAEAMAFGKPVVSTRHAGIPEALDAVLVDENDPDALAEALGRVCDDPALRGRLGGRNRAAAERLFAPTNHDQLAASLARIATTRIP